MFRLLKLKELGVKAKDNVFLDEMLKNENIDKKKFSNMLRESKILSDESRKNYPDFTTIINNSSLNMNYHKRFRHQKTVLFEDRPETFNNEFINKDNNKSLKEGIQKYVKGELAEAELNNVLKENNINPDLNSFKRQIRSASIAGQNQNKNLMLTILKNNNGEGPKDLSHATFLDFTPNTEYKEPLAKKTKRLYANNQSFLSDKTNFYWFGCDDSNINQKMLGHYRNNSSLNLLTSNTAQKKTESYNNYKFVKPSDPSLNKMDKKLLTVSSRNNIQSYNFFNDENLLQTILMVNNIILNNIKSKLEMRNKDMQQKITVINDVIKSIRNNPKFIKLLIYSMNSLENFVSPPNRQIRINAKIIIKHDGIGTLKAIAQVNIVNHEIVEKAGDIIWKCISLNDCIDQELAKLFADILGHESVIEILLSKEKGQSSKPYIKIINGLVQIPQLVQKLIDSGLIETVKLINDLYYDDFDAICLNFDTLKKISNLKVGREIVLKKNLIPNILKNIKITSAYKKPDVIITGLQILDNISRSEDGKQTLKQNEAIENISNILDFFQNNDDVLRIGAKIYSKISSPEDALALIEQIREIQLKDDYSDLKALEKALVLISNFILVDEISNVLTLPENLQVIKKIFDSISNLDLSKGKNKEYIENYILLNKYFMVIFHRLFNILPKFFEDEEIKANINKSILSNYAAVCEIKKQNFIQKQGESKSFSLAFSEYFSSFADLFEKNYQSKNPEESLIVDIITIIKNESSFLEEEKPNFSASRILKIANRLRSDSVKKLFEELFDFMISSVKNSENVETLGNVFEILADYYASKFNESEVKSLTVEKNGSLKHLGAALSPEKMQKIAEYNLKRDVLIDVALRFMNEKPKHRKPNLYTMKIVALAITDPIFLDKYQKAKTPNMLFDPIISVMAKHIYETSNIFEIVSIQNQSDISSSKNNNNLFLSEELESEISKEGVKILEKLVDQAEFLKLIKTLKEIISSFAPAKALPQTIEQLENNLLLTFCVLKVKNFFNTDLKGIVECLKNIIKKEVGFIEAFKKEKSGKTQAEDEESIKDSIKSSSKRILLQIGIMKLILDNCIRNYNEARSFISSENANESNPNFVNCAKYLGVVKDIVKVYLEFFDKSNDTDNIVNVLDNLAKNVGFVLNNESEVDNNALELRKNNENSHNYNSSFKNNVYLKDANNNVNNKSDGGVLVLITNNLINLLRKNIDFDKISDTVCSVFLSFCKKKLEICDVLVKSGCPRLLLSIIEISNNSDLARKSLELLKTIMISSDENLNMISNQNVFEKIFEINTKFQNDERIKSTCDLITSQLIKLPNQEKIISTFIESSIYELNTQLNSTDFHENFDNIKNNILNNLEKINAFSTANKINPKLLEKNFIENLLKQIHKALEDKEISDLNEKMLSNLLSVFALIQKGKGFKKLGEAGKALFNEYLLKLLEAIKAKSHYKDLFIFSLRSICKLIYNKENFEKLLADKINNDFIDGLFASSENYLEENQVSREINNTLCGLCINSDKLAKYIVERGGLANIIDELKFLVNEDDPQSENIKYSGLKFIDTIVTEDSNMEKFIQLKGANLINKFLKRFFADEENENSSGGGESAAKSRLAISDYLTNTTICLFNDKKQQSENEPSAPSAAGSKLVTRFSLKNVLFGNLEENASREMDNADLSSNFSSAAAGSSRRGNERFKKGSFIGDFLNIGSSEEIEGDSGNRGGNRSFYKKTSNLFKPMMIKKTKNVQKFAPYLVYCIKIIDTNVKLGRQDFNNPKLFKNIISLIKVNFPNLALFNKAIEFLSDSLNFNKNIDLSNTERRKLIQLILSNFAKYHDCEEIVRNALPIIKGLEYEDDLLREIIKVAIRCNELHTESQENNNNNNKKGSASPADPLLSITNNPEIKSKFLTYLSLYLENEINISHRKNNPNVPESDLNNLILDYFNSVIKILTDVEHYDNIGFTHDQGFSLALLKIRKFLEKNNLLVLKDDYYTEKIFNCAVKFFNAENLKFVNKLVKHFNNIYTELYKIKKTKIKNENENDAENDTVSFICDENEAFNEQEKTDFIEDFYSFNNLIAENIFGFLDYLNNKASNAADKLDDEAIETISKLVQMMVNYSQCKNENNALRLNYVPKLASYLMTFLLNDRLNEEKANMPAVKALLGKFWELLNNLLKMDENNSISTNDELIASLIDKLNIEIPNDPNNQTLREIYTSVSSKLENSIEIFEKIIDFAKKEIISFNENKTASADSINNNQNNNNNNAEKNNLNEENLRETKNDIKLLLSDSAESNKISLEEQQLQNLNHDLDLLKNLAKFNITSRLLQKNEDLVNKLKSLYKNFESEFSNKTNLKNKHALAKTHNLLFNILACVLSAKSNIDTIISEHADILKKIISDLKSNKILSLQSDSEKLEKREDLAQKTLKAEAALLAQIAKENFTALSDNTVKILDGCADLRKIQANLAADATLHCEYEELIKKISVLDSDREISESLENAKAEINEICKKIESFYNEHNEQMALYQLQQKAEKDAEENNNNNTNNLSTLNRFTTLNNNTLANASSSAVKKMSLISRNILFSLKEFKFKSPLSAKDNEQIESLIEKTLSFLTKLHSENKADKADKRIAERNPLISRLLNSLKFLSVSAHNHILILELGLINFMEKLQSDKENLTNNIYIYLEALDLAKNCTAAEAAIPLFISSPIAEHIIKETSEMYDKPELISNNLDMRIKFKSTNKIFSNLCKNQKGFNFVFNKLGMPRLLELAKKTYNEFILEAVLEMVLSYVQINDAEKVLNILSDVFGIVVKAFKVFEKNRDTTELLIKALLVLGSISNAQTAEKIAEYDLPALLMKYDLAKMLKNLAFFNALVFCLGSVVLHNSKIAKNVFDCGLLKKIKENVPGDCFSGNGSSNLALLEQLTLLLANLLKSSVAIAQKFLEGEFTAMLFLILEKVLFAGEISPQNIHGNSNITQSNLNNLNLNVNNNNNNNNNNFAFGVKKPNNENDEIFVNAITLNVISCLDSLTMYDKAVEALAQTKFNNMLMDTIGKKHSEIEIVKLALHALGNYLSNEQGQNIKTLNFEKLISTLQMIQTKLYSNSDVLIYVNYIAGYLIKNMKELKDKESLFRIIIVGIKAQDWNAPLIISTLKLTNEIFESCKILQENFFCEILPSLLNLIKIHMAATAGNIEVLLAAYKLILLFAKVYFNTLEMVSEGLLNYMKETFDYIQRAEPKMQLFSELNEILFKILDLLLIDLNTKKKASEIFIGKFILDLKSENAKALSPNAAKIVSFLYSVFEIKDKRNEFVQYNGVETLLPILSENMGNLSLIKSSFLLFSRLVSEEDEFKKLLKNLKVVELINEVSKSAQAMSDKEYSFIAAALISDINDIKTLLQKIEDAPITSEVKVFNNPIKAEIRNFVTNGRMIRMVDDSGSKQSMLLVMTNDLMKIMAKKINSNMAPKDKYIIDVSTIKKISRGYANNSFKKSVGFFSTMFSLYPEPNRCFTIISNTNMSNSKIFNVKCATEDECFKWITYLKSIIEHLTKTKAIMNKIEFEVKQ